MFLIQGASFSLIHVVFHFPLFSPPNVKLVFIFKLFKCLLLLVQMLFLFPKIETKTLVRHVSF